MSSPYALATAPSRSSERKFTFPDAVPEVPDIVLPDMRCVNFSFFVIDLRPRIELIVVGGYTHIKEQNCFFDSNLAII